MIFPKLAYSGIASPTKKAAKFPSLMTVIYARLSGTPVSPADGTDITLLGQGRLILLLGDPVLLESIPCPVAAILGPGSLISAWGAIGSRCPSMIWTTLNFFYATLGAGVFIDDRS